MARVLAARSASRSTTDRYPVWTPALLDVLRDCRVQATFFVIGEKVECHPEIVLRTGRGGPLRGESQLLSHRPGIDLDPTVDRRGPSDKSLARGIAGIRRHTIPSATRPADSLETIAAVGRRQTVVLWNVDPKDFAAHDRPRGARLVRGARLRGGDLVLLHDRVPHAIEIIPNLVERARASARPSRPLPTGFLDPR